MIDVIYQFFMIAVNMIADIFTIKIPFYDDTKISLGEFIIAVLTIGAIIGFVMQFMSDKGVTRGGRKEDE